MGQPASDQAGTSVWVRRQWNDYRKARYLVSDLGGLHWGNVSGGVRAKAPQQFLYGYVDCDRVLEGEVAHSGLHGPCPHSIKVCVLKKDNDPEAYRLVEEDVGQKPVRQLSCAEQAIRLVGEADTLDGPTLRVRLKILGFGRMHISQVLPKLERKGLLVSRLVGRMKVYELPQHEITVHTT